MFKQYVAVIIICFSAILMVGHDVIPHDHDQRKEHHHTGVHHSHAEHSHASKQHSSSNDSSDEKGGISDLLSYFVHTGDFSIEEATVIQLQDVENERNTIPSADFISNSSIQTRFNSKSIGYNYKGPGYIPPYSNSKGLRAPPVFLS